MIEGIFVINVPVSYERSNTVLVGGVMKWY